MEEWERGSWRTFSVLAKYRLSNIADFHGNGNTDGSRLAAPIAVCVCVKRAHIQTQKTNIMVQQRRMKSNGEKICERNDLIEYKMYVCVRENNERAKKKKRIMCDMGWKKLKLLAGVSYLMFIVLTFAYWNIVRKYHSLSFRFIPFTWIENVFHLSFSTRVFHSFCIVRFNLISLSQSRSFVRFACLHTPIALMLIPFITYQTACWR